jgi:hypothetical protein
MKLSQSHDLSYEFCKLTWVDLGQYILIYPNILFYIQYYIFEIYFINI